MSHTSKRVTSRHMSHHFQSLRYAIFVLALLVALVPTFTLTACDTPAPSSHITSSQLLSEEVPAYTGQPSVEVDDDKPSFSDEELSYARENEGFESFSELDDLGRCGSVTVCVGPETMPQEGEERGSIGMIKPSGWQTSKYNFVDGSYLYNRCHLVGWQLSGENANERNLVTGTRSMNVEGMLSYEDEVASYVDQTGNHVLYRATPIFEGDELVCRGVQIEAYSLEDDGAGISFNVFCYNVEPGVGIDYATGDNAEGDETAAFDAETTVSNNESSATSEAADVEDKTESYVLNTNTMRFHNPTCPSVEDIADNNKEAYEGSRQALIDEGYKPCGRCKP